MSGVQGCIFFFVRRVGAGVVFLPSDQQWVKEIFAGLVRSPGSADSKGPIRRMRDGKLTEEEAPVKVRALWISI